MEHGHTLPYTEIPVVRSLMGGMRRVADCRLD